MQLNKKHPSDQTVACSHIGTGLIVVCIFCAQDYDVTAAPCHPVHVVMGCGRCLRKCAAGNQNSNHTLARCSQTYILLHLCRQRESRKSSRKWSMQPWQCAVACLMTKRSDTKRLPSFCVFGACCPGFGTVMIMIGTAMPRWRLDEHGTKPLENVWSVSGFPSKSYGLMMAMRLIRMSWLSTCKKGEPADICQPCMRCMRNQADLGMSLFG